MTDAVDWEIGQVFDQADLDSKLTRLRVRGTPVFTGRDMEEIETHYGKAVGDLTVAQMQTSAAYVYLRRALGRPITWDQASDVAVEVIADEAPDPTGSGPSAPSPPSAATGG